MIATNIRTIRESVIFLHRISGYSVIEATDLWNKVYSLQYQQAKSGTRHAWAIGEYTFEFTKQDACPPTQTVEQTTASYGLFKVIVICAILTVLTLIVLIGAKSAHAMPIDPIGGRPKPTVSFNAVQVTTFVKPARKFHCTVDPTRPALWYYLDDDGTPLDVAYEDYLSDLAWHYEQYPKVCRTAPEPKP